MATTAHAGYPQHATTFKRPPYPSNTVSSASAHATSNTAVVSSPPEAPWYGHEETAVICGRFVCETFSSPELFSSDQQRYSTNPTLPHFVAYALYRTRLHQSVTFTALRLLHRLKSRFPAAKGSSGHRLFICSFMIASKVVCDDTYSNKSWCVVGQNLFSLKEMNQMEREMCGYLDWQLNVDSEELASFERDLRRDYGFTSSSSSRPTSVASLSKPAIKPANWTQPSRPSPPPLVIPSRLSFTQPQAVSSAISSSPPSATSTDSHSFSPSSSTPPTPASSAGPSPASSEETCLTPESEPGVSVAIPIDSLCSPVDVHPYAPYHPHHMITMPIQHATNPKPQRSHSEPTILPSKQAPHRTFGEKIESKGGLAIAMPAMW